MAHQSKVFEEGKVR